MTFLSQNNIQNSNANINTQKQFEVTRCTRTCDYQNRLFRNYSVLTVLCYEVYDAAIPMMAVAIAGGWNADDALNKNTYSRRIYLHIFLRAYNLTLMFCNGIKTPGFLSGLNFWPPSRVRPGGENFILYLGPELVNR